MRNFIAGAVCAVIALTGCGMDRDEFNRERREQINASLSNPLTGRNSNYPASDYAVEWRGLERVVHHYTCPDVDNNTVRMTTRWASDYADAQYRQSQANRIPKQAHVYTWSDSTTFSVQRKPGEKAVIRFEGNRLIRCRDCLK